MAEKKQKAGYDSKVTDKKKAVVAELKEQLTTSKGAVLTSYKGLTVAMDTELRRELRAAGVTYHVVKNTMMNLAAKEAGLEGLNDHLAGTTALAFSKDDAIAPAKVICGFMKKNKLEDPGILTVKAGLVEGKVISDKEVKALANLPSREELIAKLLGSMNAPIANTVGVLSAIIRNFVYVVDAVREKKEKESA
ncbi:MAG: 50S ribosomal protein L10 [Selenomonadaceae bacterium]|nr:50S ribosomal protein L10 [Selenomonadaceae bacterium]